MRDIIDFLSVVFVIGFVVFAINSCDRSKTDDAVLTFKWNQQDHCEAIGGRGYFDSDKQSYFCYTKVSTTAPVANLIFTEKYVPHDPAPNQKN